MLDFLGEKEAADRIVQAMMSVTAERRVLTADIGGRATTMEVAEAVAAKLRALAR